MNLRKTIDSILIIVYDRIFSGRFELWDDFIKEKYDGNGKIDLRGNLEVRSAPKTGRLYAVYQR